MELPEFEARFNDDWLQIVSDKGVISLYDYRDRETYCQVREDFKDKHGTWSEVPSQGCVDVLSRS